MYLETSRLLRRCQAEVAQFTPPSLASFFGLPLRHFQQASKTSPITFHQAGHMSAMSYTLRGTIFWPDDKQIVRGFPRILPTSDYTPERFVSGSERLTIQAAREGDAVIEDKLPGTCIRLYHHQGELLCATTCVYDGGNPIVAAGVENADALGLDYGAQASGLIASRYPKATRLAKLGYQAVFVLLMPEVDSPVAVDRPDLILIDVVDPDHQFVERLEKERIAEDYGLKVVPMEGHLTLPGAPTPGEDGAFKRLRGLEHQAAREGRAGYVIKACFEGSDQLYLKVEPAAVRDWSPGFSQSDLAATFSAIHDDFAQTFDPDPEFLEELMLDYLGSRNRKVRWQVQDFLRLTQSQPDLT